MFGLPAVETVTAVSVRGGATRKMSKMQHNKRYSDIVPLHRNAIASDEK